MFKSHPLLHFIFVSILALLVSLGVSFLVIFLAQDILYEPQKYLLFNSSPSQIQFVIISTAGVIVSISISLITFLILSSNARAELSIWKSTRWLAISREQFRRLYDNAPIPYLTLNNKGEIYEPNKAALRFFNATVKEIDGKSLFSFFAEDENKNVDRLLQQYTLEIPINRESVTMVNSKGEKKYVLLSIFGIKNPASKTHTGLATVFDITEIKKLDTAKTEFLSIASHQLRTPMATMKWYTEMLLSNDLGELTTKQKDYLQRLFAVNQNTIELVETFLNISRIEIGTLPIDLKQVNAEELVKSVIAEFKPQIEQKSLLINTQFNQFLQNVKTDPKLLRIVIQNLVSNAIKYTPNGGTITITFDEARDVRKIIVSDTGLGIPENQQNQIFTKLFRADNVKKMATERGSGLGLFLTKSIVETLGGSISFTSAENKGSTFTVNI
jgi:PAS domain S-box-containing protein